MPLIATVFSVVRCSDACCADTSSILDKKSIRYPTLLILVIKEWVFYELPRCATVRGSAQDSSPFRRSRCAVSFLSCSLTGDKMRAIGAATSGPAPCQGSCCHSTHTDRNMVRKSQEEPTGTTRLVCKTFSFFFLNLCRPKELTGCHRFIKYP